QDTVIALQALAVYGEATYNSVTQNVVKITSKKSFQKVFIVSNENRLLLQQTPLPEVPGKYSLTVNGSGCVFMQVSVCSPLHCVSHSAYNTVMQLRFVSPGTVQTDTGLCFSYTGKRSSSNMVIIDVKMLSGFVPVTSSLDKVNYGSKIKR
ncbi:OVOS protein, partial [Anhinga rufa]|nr:OVOS protein [Anhinga rufa]